LLACMASLINSRYNGRIRKRFAFDLCVARTLE
jgi:hypothetical protein